MPFLQLTLLNDKTILLNIDHIVAIEDNDAGALVITTARYKDDTVMYPIKENSTLVLRQISQIHDID